MQMKKIMNYRPILYFALSLILGVALATYIFIAPKLKLILFFIFLYVAAIMLILRVTLKIKIFTLFTVCFILIAIPFMQLYIKSNKLNDNLIYSNDRVFIEGRLSENYKFTTSGNLALILDDVSVLDGETKNKIDGNIVVYTSPSNMTLSELKVGRYLNINMKLNFCTLSKDLTDSIYNLTNGNIATGYAEFYNIDFLNKYAIDFNDEVRQHVYETIDSSGAKYTEVGYGMLFGDTTVISTDVKTIFQSTGIAHLLAVSGLHVSIILFIISASFKRLRNPIKPKIVLVTLTLAVYCYLCDFSVSVMRASLMAVAMAYSEVRALPYDNLNILSLIVIIFLLMNPLTLFDISFVLSFTSVLAIILLSTLFERIFGKYFYDKVSSTLAINMSVQIGLIATNLFYFGKIQLLGVICNFIAVPIAIAAFSILLITFVFTPLFPFLNFGYNIFGFLMDLVVKFSYYISKIDITFTAGGVSILFVIIMFAFMFVFSDYVFVSRKKKAGICGTLILIGGLLLFL